MGRRITYKDVEWVKLKPSAFLTEWTKRTGWNLEDFGAYCLLNFFLYDEGGKLPNDPAYLAGLCRVTELEFARVWKNIESKFQKRARDISHHRVRLELQRARRELQSAVNKGLRGADARWQRQCPSYEKKMQTRRDRKTDRYNSSSSSNPPKIDSDSLRFASSLEEVLPPVGKSNNRAFRNLYRWLAAQIAAGRFNREDIYRQVLDYARAAKQKGDKPLAFFFATLRRELGYRPKRNNGQN